MLDMVYDERVSCVAGIWRFAFINNDLTKDELESFHKCCKEYKVSEIDVLAYMDSDEIYY